MASLWDILELVCSLYMSSKTFTVPTLAEGTIHRENKPVAIKAI